VSAVADGAAALGAGARWATHPTADDARPATSTVSGPLLLPGSSLLAGLGLRPDHDSVTLSAVTPLVTSNTAGATIRVAVCDRGPTRSDVDGHVVVEITPTRPGAVSTRGARVRYRDGLQLGTQEHRVRLDFTSR
jgi:hypothetical protein